MLIRRRMGYRLGSAVLALFVGLLPVLRPLHLQFAAHDHTYCPEHDRMEDVLPGRPAPAFVVAPVDGPGLLPLGVAGLESDRVPCVVLNSPSLRFAYEPEPSHAALEPAANKGAPTTFRARRAGSRPLHRLAPKASPPAFC